MEYRSFSDLSTAINNNITKIPHDVDLIVGIPRSGLMAGNLMALHLNVPIVDLDGYLENTRINAVNAISTRNTLRCPKDAHHVLLVDDTIYAGKSMIHAENLIRKESVDQRISTCTVYANPRTASLVDIYFELLESPGCQEWNVMHRDKLEHFCVDIDGVLCKDPLKQDDDDGPAYLNYLNEATPLMLPSKKAGYLVTGRLEKYREQTESWLRKYNIQYKELHMLDLPDANTRWRLRAAAKFKARVYKSYPHSQLFIESDPHEAEEIAILSGKQVLCFSNQKLITPGFSTARFKSKVRNYRVWAVKKAKRLAKL